jgi:hypothetical protein
MERVRNVAKFVRKYSKFPIYNAYGLMDIWAFWHGSWFYC